MAEINNTEALKKRLALQKQRDTKKIKSKRRAPTLMTKIKKQEEKKREKAIDLLHIIPKELKRDKKSLSAAQLKHRLLEEDSMRKFMKTIDDTGGLVLTRAKQKFFNQLTPQLKKKYPNSDDASIQRELEQRWEALPDDEKRVYLLLSFSEQPGVSWDRKPFIKKLTNLNTLQISDFINRYLQQRDRYTVFFEKWIKRPATLDLEKAGEYKEEKVDDGIEKEDWEVFIENIQKKREQPKKQEEKKRDRQPASIRTIKHLGPYSQKDINREYNSLLKMDLDDLAHISKRYNINPEGKDKEALIAIIIDKKIGESTLEERGESYRSSFLILLEPMSDFTGIRASKN